MRPAAVHVELLDWESARAIAAPIRFKVFVEEQKVPEESEIDERDPHCVHALARGDDGRAVGTGRLLPDGHIGRMAVLREWRGRKVGTTMIGALLELARAQGRRRILLNSQTHAMAFYARFGFEPRGMEFTEAGIPHREMVLDLQPSEGTSHAHQQHPGRQ